MWVLLIKSYLKRCVLSKFLKLLKFSSLRILKSKLFHSFGATAKKVRSPSVFLVITLGVCRRSPLFDLRLYLLLSLILISSQI